MDYNEKHDNNREAILRETIALIEERDGQVQEITVREICRRANVGLGLINYHFGNKDKLIEQCVEYMVSGIVDNFRAIRERTEGFEPLEKLEYLGNMTLTFLFNHYAISKISILTDMRAPKEDDNTIRTYRAYLPLVAACRPDWDEAAVRRKTFCLIAVMQQTVLRYEAILHTQGIDLMKEDERRRFHRQMLHDILEV